MRKALCVGICLLYTSGREFIIALPESFVQYRADDVVRLFTETFHKRYGVECSAALHHNKAKTNYHIHLVFSERKILEQPEVKIAVSYTHLDVYKRQCSSSLNSKESTSDTVSISKSMNRLMLMPRAFVIFSN